MSKLLTNTTDLQEVLQTLQNKAASGEQATPVISVDYNGLITATAGTKSSTHQLAFQPAKTITPTIADQIAVSSGYYTGGNVVVKGDANLVAGNIKSGVSIFGIDGNYEGSSGGSGDGSSIETCAVQFQLGDAPMGDPFIVYYTDTNFASQILNDFGSFIVPKNTIIAIENWTSTSLVSGATRLIYGAGLFAYQVTDDAIFTLQ